MFLGKITGKTTTSSFSFNATEPVQKFQYCQIMHKDYGFVLAQIIELESSVDGTQAKCGVLGYFDENKIRQPLIPFEPGTEVLDAETDFIKTIVELSDKGAYLGKLAHKDVNVYLDLNKLLTKHVAVLAKSGSGKSYTVGVLLEEIIKQGIPALIIDPHGEYTTLAQPSDEQEEVLAKYGVKAEGLPMQEFALHTQPKPGEIAPKPLYLNARLNQTELQDYLGKLNANQQAIMYSALKGMQDITFDNVLLALEAEESSAKFTIMNHLEYLRGLKLFSNTPTSYNELIKPKRANIINLKGVNPDVQEIIVYKLCKDLFELRKQNRISPFFLVIEEAHNFCPERSFGEKKSSKILRNIASEGRKFGLGLCVISQRPARVDKSILSQCTTQLILKVTNPNDIKAISNSVEGITSDTEKEIQNMSIGTTLVTGVTDLPLFVHVRPRQTLHGGTAVDMLNMDEQDFMEHAQSFEEQELLAVIKPALSKHDYALMQDDQQPLRTKLTPALLVQCKDKEPYQLLVERLEGRLVTNIDSYQTKQVPPLRELNQQSMLLLQSAFKLKKFSIEELRANARVAPEASVQALFDHQLLTLVGTKYSLNPEYVFSKLSSVQTWGKPNYEQVTYDKKEEARVSIDDIKLMLSAFTNVMDYEECYVLSYDAA